MMQYMILTASVLVLVLSTGVNADSPKTRLKAAKLVDMVKPANGSKNKAEPVDTPVRAQAAGCDSYELYGCIYQSEIHGWYSKTSYTCSSKPVYSDYSSDYGETIYLFYTSSGQWAFSDIRCDTSYYVGSVSHQNNFPDEVVSWEESNNSGSRYRNSGIGVKCVSTASTLATTQAPGVSTASTLAPTQAPGGSDTANINPLVVLILLVCGCVATW